MRVVEGYHLFDNLTIAPFSIAKLIHHYRKSRGESISSRPLATFIYGYGSRFPGRSNLGPFFGMGNHPMSREENLESV